MHTPTQTIELPRDPIQAYFVPWKGKRETDDPTLIKYYERLYSKRRREHNIELYGLTTPMKMLFRELFISFSMFCSVCAMILFVALVIHRAQDFHASDAGLSLLKGVAGWALIANVLLLIISISKSLFQAIKRI